MSCKDASLRLFYPPIRPSGLPYLQPGNRIIIRHFPIPLANSRNTSSVGFIIRDGPRTLIPKPKIKKMKRLFYFTLVLQIVLVFLSGCAPAFSELQSARTVGKRNFDVTGAFSTVNFSEDSKSEHVQNHLGFQAAYGLTDGIDFRARYEYIWLDAEGENISANILGFGPKFSILQDRIAGYLPLGFAFGEDIEETNTWQFHPTLLVTLPVEDVLEINPSFKVLLPFEEEMETLVAVNLGLGLRISKGLILRPEYGLLFNPGESGHYGQFSVGVTINPADGLRAN